MNSSDSIQSWVAYVLKIVEWIHTSLDSQNFSLYIQMIVSFDVQNSFRGGRVDEQLIFRYDWRLFICFVMFEDPEFVILDKGSGVLISRGGEVVWENWIPIKTVDELQTVTLFIGKKVPVADMGFKHRRHDFYSWGC